MEIIRVFVIFGLVTPILSFNLISENKCSVYKTFLQKYNLKKCSFVKGYYINLDSNKQLV